MTINWKTSKTDFALIVAIAERIEAEIPNHPDKRQTIIMDLTACHSNGCPLRLAELLTAPRFDFTHDVLGIRQHINRKTGQLENCFVPRYAQPETAGEWDTSACMLDPAKQEGRITTAAELLRGEAKRVGFTS